MKTWAMRGTLHLIAAGDLPLYVAARSLFESRGWVKYFDYYGIRQPLYETFLAAAPRILGSEPLTANSSRRSGRAYRFARAGKPGADQGLGHAAETIGLAR